MVRSRTDKWLGGVCGGLAAGINLPVWFVRLLWVFFGCCGVGLVAYLLLCVVLPVEDETGE